MNDEVFIGTELKLNIHIAPMGDITMDDYDFEVDVYCSPKRTVHILKADALRIDAENYVVLVDTAVLGAGDIKVKVTAFIPDGDCDDMLRTEVVALDTGLVVIKSI